MKWALFVTLTYLLSLASGEIDLQDIEIPDIDDLTVIKDRCDERGGKGTFEKVKTAKDSLTTCLQGLVDVETLKNEVEEAKKTGSMDEVFGKYCAKRPIVANCVRNFTDTISLCMEDAEKQALNITLEIVKQLGEFICFKDGDRIAMFVAEGGVECIKDHAEGIKNCVNKTFKIETEINTNALPNLLIDKKKCDDLGKLQACVVEELEKCKDSTPANIVDALFRFVKKSACNTKSKRSTTAHKLFKRSASLVNELYNSADTKSKIMRIVKEKCTENAPDGGYESFIASAENTSACIQQSVRRHRMFVTPKDEFKQNIGKCAEAVIEKAENCLPEEEKYYPNFYFDVIYSLIDFGYANKDRIIANTMSAEGISCFRNFNSNESKKSLVQCFSADDSERFDKQKLCKHMKEVRKCVSEEFNKKCIKDVEVNRLIEDFFVAFNAPCEAKV